VAHVKYFWDEIEDNVIREYDENNNTIAHYTTEPELYGRVISQDRGGEVRHYKYDGQGNTVALTDNSGNVTDTRKYSAFGEVTESTGTTEFPYQWGGRWGYLYLHLYESYTIRARQYAIKTGRWMSPDPNGLSDDANTYRYVKGKANSRIDPSGRRSVRIDEKNCIIELTIYARFQPNPPLWPPFFTNTALGQLIRDLLVAIFAEIMRLEVLAYFNWPFCNSPKIVPTGPLACLCKCPGGWTPRLNFQIISSNGNLPPGIDPGEITDIWVGGTDTTSSADPARATLDLFDILYRGNQVTCIHECGHVLDNPHPWYLLQLVAKLVALTTGLDTPNKEWILDTIYDWRYALDNSGLMGNGMAWRYHYYRAWMDELNNREPWCLYGGLGGILQRGAESCLETITNEWPKAKE
jgi:RHS repeat-associated protein